MEMKSHLDNIRGRLWGSNRRDDMTNIYDEQNNIWELQTFLRDFSRVEEGAPLINPDGIFGPETVAAVRFAQNRLGLEVSGAADFATWEALFTSFRHRRLRG